MSKAVRPRRPSIRARVSSLQRSEPKIPTRRPGGAPPFAATRSPIASANDDVAHNAVVPRSAMSSSCRSVWPGPDGIAIAPTRSTAAWNPQPAVQRP